MDDTPGWGGDPGQGSGGPPPAPPPVPGYGGASGYGSPPGYGSQPGYGPPPAYGGPQAFGAMPYASPYPQMAQDPGRGMQVAGLVCGIVGFAFAPFILGPLGIIFGSIGRKRSREAGFTELGMGLAGIICGSIATVLSLLIIVGVIIAIASAPRTPYG